MNGVSYHSVSSGSRSNPLAIGHVSRLIFDNFILIPVAEMIGPRVRDPRAVSSERRQQTPTVKSSCQSPSDQIYRANRIFREMALKYCLDEAIRAVWST